MFTGLVSFVRLRITRNRYISAYFVFTLVFCFVQAIVLSLLLSLNQQHYGILTGIIEGGHLPKNTFTLSTRPAPGQYILEACFATSHFETNAAVELANCTTIFKTGTPPRELVIPTSIASLNSSGELVGQGSNDLVEVDGQCLVVTTRPRQIIQNIRREDIVLVALQFWLLLISVLGIKNESISDILGVFSVRILLTAWSAYSITTTNAALDEFAALVHGPFSPCGPHIGIYKVYIDAQQRLQKPDMALNAIGVVMSAFLTFKLVKTYDQRGFNRIGAPPRVRQIYQLFLGSLASLHVSVVFLTIGVGLWIDQLVSFAPLIFSVQRPLYLALSITALVVLIPWAGLGWYSIRKERRLLMVAFLLFSLLGVGAWITLFFSPSYRLMFVQWNFFGAIMLIASISLFFTIFFAILCWFQFNKGLAQYLDVEAVLAKSNFIPDSFEKNIENASPAPVASSFPLYLLERVDSRYSEQFETQKRALFASG